MLSRTASGARMRSTVLGALAALALLLLPATSSRAQSSRAQFPGGPTFTVNSTGDQPDPLPDGSCNATPGAPSPTCTLRAALQEADQPNVRATITFAPGLGVIRPQSELPPVGPVEIQGDTVNGTVVDGSQVSTTTDGLTTVGGATIDSLQITGFRGAGLNMLRGGGLTNSSSFSNQGAGIVAGANAILVHDTVAQNGGAGVSVLAGPVRIVNTSAVGNGGDGVEVVGGSGVEISGGGFAGNGGLGIDLNADGVTANDPGDPDTGPNGLQNFPVLTGATTTGPRTQPGQEVVVRGTIDSSGPVTIRVYGNDTCDASGNGEGAFFVGQQQGVGTGAFTVTLPGASAAEGEVLTATATDSGGNTSEFSNCTTAVLVGADLGVTKSASPGAVSGEFVTAGNTIHYVVTVSNDGPDPATNVTLTDLLPHPSFASFGSATPSQGTCGTPDSNGALPCQLGTLAVGGHATIDLFVTATWNTSTNLTNQVFSLDADQTDPVCTVEPAEPGQTDTPTCDGAEAVTHVEPADGQAGGFVAAGGTLSTGATATASDPTVVSLSNDGSTGTTATLVEVGCAGTPDPLCADPNIVGNTLAGVSIAGSTAAAPAAPTPSAPFTATLTYDKTIVPASRVRALHVYAGSVLLANCGRKVVAPCIRSLKVLSGSKDLEVKVALTGSAKLRTTTS
jgi:uncharacterized repeat protein (TIGR01451 family)/CSLREA domain-containing protein